MTRFTLIIPTRERCETLPHTIRACLDQDYDDYTVIVSDNVSTDATRDVVHSFSDPRLRYVRPDRRLSMSSHFNFAIGQATDGWVTTIGDDDAILPGALQHADELVREHGGMPIAAGSVYYGWPGFPDAELANRLTFASFSKAVRVRDSRAVVRERIAFRTLDEEYVWGMPSVYRGFLPVDLIRRCVRNGRYINSVTPDAYSAFATALSVPFYVHTARPLFVEGVSAKSNGAAQTLLANTDEEKRYLAENDIAIHPDTVYCTASAFVMIEAFLQACAAFPELAGDLAADFQAMCVRARLESPPARLPGVLAAAVAIRKRHRLPPEPRAALAAAIGRRRLRSVRLALNGLDVDGEAYSIRNVYDAAIVAGALWNYKLGTGHREGGALFVERLGKFVAKRLHRPAQAGKTA
jgi:glycosyltransferase involved in cell wall biosynthesis